MRKFATLLFVFVLFAITADCSRLERVTKKFKEVDMKPLSLKEKNRPIAKEIDLSQPAQVTEEQTPNSPVEQPKEETSFE